MIISKTVPSTFWAPAHLMKVHRIFRSRNESKLRGWLLNDRIVLKFGRCLGNNVNRSLSQNTIPISLNAQNFNRNVPRCTHFCYKVVYCGIIVWCIVGFVIWIYFVQQNSESRSINTLYGGLIYQVGFKNLDEVTIRKKCQNYGHVWIGLEIVLC